MVLPDAAKADPVEYFAPATRDWFGSAFPSPAAVQTAARAAIDAGDNALVIAPTGSGQDAGGVHASHRPALPETRGEGRDCASRRQSGDTHPLHLTESACATAARHPL